MKSNAFHRVKHFTKKYALLSLYRPPNQNINFPANICWSWRRLEAVFKTCLKDVFNTSSAQQFYIFQDILKTPWRRLAKTFWRSLEDLLQDVLKTSSRRLGDVLKTCIEDLLKILWRQTKHLLGISVYLSRDLTNLNLYLTSLYFTNLYLTTLKRIQNALLTGDWFGVMKLA